MTTEITVPCVAAHLLVTPQPGTDLRCDRCGASASLPLGATCDDHQPRPLPRPMVLRFLPTDADTECETCGGSGVFPHLTDAGWVDDCDDCDGEGSRLWWAGDRIAIRADDNVPADLFVVGDWAVAHRSEMLIRRSGERVAIPLRPGEVVGYATVANVLPIVDGIPSQDSWRKPWRIITTEPWPVVTSWPGYGSAHPELALVDHVDAGLVFTPGQVALELAAEG